jgi:hypothetical protein
MSNYKVIYHGADSEGGEGHFFVELVDENGTSNFYGFHPTNNPLLAKAQIKTDDNISYLDNLQSGDSHIYAEQILTEEGYNNVKNFIEDKQTNAGWYFVVANNCIDFCQDVYKITGVEGNFTNYFTKEDLLKIDTLGDGDNLGGGEYAFYKYGSSDYESPYETIKDYYQATNRALYELYKITTGNPIITLDEILHNNNQTPTEWLEEMSQTLGTSLEEFKASFTDYLKDYLYNLPVGEALADILSAQLDLIFLKKVDTKA